jgi:hypothetical protein
MTQTQFVYFGVHFGAKTADFWRKSVKMLLENSKLLNHQ